MTGAELKVCRRWVTANEPRKTLADTLGISLHTVDKHITAVYRRMGSDGAHNQLGLARWLVAKGYVKAEEVIAPTDERKSDI